MTDQPDDTQELEFTLSVEDIKRNFPFVPRGNQSWVLEEIAKVIVDPKIKFVVVQAPTGSGKSPLAMSIARSVDSAYIATANKNLQDQYSRDFAQYLADLRGRVNYPCCRFPGFNCADSPCRKTAQGRQKCAEAKGCDYHVAVATATKAPISLLNFSAALAFLNYHPNFDKRDVLIVDEAHLIEDQLTAFIEFSVEAADLIKLGIMLHGDRIPQLGTPLSYVPWVERMLANCEMIEAGKSFTGNYQDFESVKRKLEVLKAELQADANNMIMEQTTSKMPGSLAKISFRPLDISRHAKDRLFKYGEKVVLMSATIINFPSFIRALGIEPEEAAFIDVPSTFPKENRPIHKAYAGELTYHSRDWALPKFAQVVAAVMNRHANEKGIIHIPSYDIGDKLFAMLPGSVADRILYPRKAGDQAQALVEHNESSKATVLMSPSMAEGVDLKDDLSRFQIITKVPYASMGDKLIKARMDRPGGGEWYTTKAMTKLIQSYGRSIRSETDTAVTYILDAGFDRAYSKIRFNLPKWFREVVE